MSDEAKKGKPMKPVHITVIQQFLAECRVTRKVKSFEEPGNAMAVAVQKGDVVYVVDKKGCAHLNAGYNLSEALREVGWSGFVGSILRVGTRQSVSGVLDWAHHVCGSTQSPIRRPDFEAIDAAKAAAEPALPALPELAPVIPLTPQQ